MDAVVIISLKSRVSENVSESLLENKIEVVRKCDTFIDILKNFVIKHSVEKVDVTALDVTTKVSAVCFKLPYFRKFHYLK